MMYVTNALNRISALFALLIIAGCASIDMDYPRVESVVISDTDDTYFGEHIAPVVATHSESESGFYPMSDGIDALATRLLMIERAEKSIDVQYYLIKDGVVGRAFVYALLKAADRGVRVRLLLDDMFTKGYDVGMSALHSHPNFEIRIFNPFSRGAAGRSLGAITSFSRVNRRLHNKSLTIDNQITIIGGRNIADEYFGAREDSKFGDLDVMAIGPVVRDVSNMFDTYWRHETALPVPAFAKAPDNLEAELDGLRVRLKQAMQDISDTKYAAAVGRKIGDYISVGGEIFGWAPYELVVDSPDKGIKSRAAEADSITTPLIESISAAKKELLIISPYFVPRKTGVEWLVGVQREGVEVSIVTNSLAANNQFTVHGGYAPSRKPLLKAGVTLFEVRPDADVAGTEFVNASGAKATLHTKAFVVDRKEIFIGSFNFDPRSAKINTELGVIIRDPELANRMANDAFAKLTTQSYKLSLTEKGDLSWQTETDGEVVTFEKEPETTWGQRFSAGLARILPKSQL
jgi:putative cardiolipin synthase